jgi:hypothetical protein
MDDFLQWGRRNRVFFLSQRAIVGFWDKAQMSPLEISPPIAIVATVSIAGKSAY